MSRNPPSAALARIDAALPGSLLVVTPCAWSALAKLEDEPSALLVLTLRLADGAAQTMPCAWSL